MDVFPYESEAYYVFDRGYVDYTRLHKITNHSAYIVIRAKSNLNFDRMANALIALMIGNQA